ncbi:MAG: YkgJ family cysteine cluster protein, partial [Nanoarchaeota archaeon]
DRKCADCCKDLTVKLYKKDILAIEKRGYSDFYEYDSHIKSPVIKMTDDGCPFLGNKDGKYYCKIYNIRPKVCRAYPFVGVNEIKSCRPALLKYKVKR